MDYRSRPAWRTQWLSLGLEFILLIGLLWIFWTVIANDPESWKLWLYLFALLCATGLVFPILYRHYAWRYSVDGENIESRYGIIARQVHSIRILDLRNVNVKQSILQRLIGIGNVEFSSAGGEGIEVVFIAITSPMQLKERVQDLQEHVQKED
ncbi:MAG: hypothetical protein BMS9Abin11_0313 [Gammaproteobacteria bacterium]|nr:MAG: hypothetical protein BMS9Abin11_0313 [Gammaproteobacteria bacterium]